MEMEERYLYGASIQGIQEYIFRTNKLSDVVGKSEVVNRVCTTAFYEMLGDDDEKKGLSLATPIVMAAGNVKCILNKELCEKAVRQFPKKVQDMAPGITFSQAVVKMEGAYSDFGAAGEELERRLRAQRNRPIKSVTMGLIGIERDRRTGLPAKVEAESNSNAQSSLNLYKKLFDKTVKYGEVALNIGNMTDKNSWIAIIHADGNGLGEVVMEVSKDSDKLREFSNKLDEATIAAAKTACNTIFKSDYKAIRPVVLGGDDLTVICRASKAIDFVKKYIEEFEKETEARLRGLLPKGIARLTACAGIAFIKASYPFYYGYNLAEELCGEAKKDAKSKEIQGKERVAPSCLMFHKVQSSFVESYGEIIRKELTPCPAENKGDKEYSWVFGPYYLKQLGTGTAEQSARWTISKLLEEVGTLSREENNMAKSDIREWMTLMTSPKVAEQKAKRVKNIGTEINKKLFEAATQVSRREGDKLASPAYDILTLLTMTTQDTKSNNIKE